MTFSFGQSKHERIEIDVQRYERSPSGDYYDDNWLTVQVSVSAGGFRGSADAAILTGELAAFYTDLRAIEDNLKGAAEFKTLEEQLNLKVTGDGKGRIELAGVFADQPGIGNRLHFTLRFDQSELSKSIRELQKITAEFPVRGI